MRELRSVGRPDRVVRLLQYGVREGREAREAGVVVSSRYSKTQSIVHFAVGRKEWR